MSIATASYLARRAAQKERVRILYRRALKDTLNWAVHRHLFYPDADALREKFEANRHVEDLELIDTMISAGESEYNKWWHSDPYSVPWKFCRKPTPPEEPLNSMIGANCNGDKSTEEAPHVADSESLNVYDRQGSGSFHSKKSNFVTCDDNNGKSRRTAPSGGYQIYAAKIAGLLRKIGILEAQLAGALAAQEAAERNMSVAVKSRQKTERKYADAMKQIGMLRAKLNSVELALEEANSHSDNVRLERKVASLKAVLDNKQKELHSTRAVLDGERVRAFQLQ